MKVGYAGMCRGVLKTKFMHCTQKYASEDKLNEIIENNFEALFHVLTYNIKQDILMFRISSDFIPFATHELNQLDWKTKYHSQFQRVHHLVEKYQLRLSMHPGQYVVLNSLNPQVVARSIEELQYHADLLDAFSLDATHKMVLHIGGIYQDKESAIQRFIAVVTTCSMSILKHLVIENDDRYFNIEDVLKISKETQIPVVYDQLHHELNPPSMYHSDMDWIKECIKTWKKRDGVMKLHYSQQAQGKRKGAHSNTINLLAFHQFYHPIKHLPLDFMIEVKDKNYSVNKIRVYLTQSKALLHQEWLLYRYLIMENSYETYAFMKRELAEDACSHFWFYQYLDEALCKESKVWQLKTARLFYEQIEGELEDEVKLKVLKYLDLLKQEKKTIHSYKKYLLSELEKTECEWQNNYYLTYDI